MADYILTYDIPNEHRTALEEVLKDQLHANRELGVSTFWRLASIYSADTICKALKEVFPAIKVYVYEVNLANAATTELTYERLEALVKALRAKR